MTMSSETARYFQGKENVADRDRPPADQGRRRREGGAGADPDHQARLCPVPRRRRGTLAAPAGLSPALSLHVLSSEEVAERAGVSTSTLRRWISEGLVPRRRGRGWRPLAAAHVRLVARLRERGHSIADIRAASPTAGSLSATSRSCSAATQNEHTLKQAAKLTGLEPALIRRIYANLGFTAETAERIGDEDLEMLQHVAEALRAGFPSRRSCSSRASTARRSSRSPTPRCGCSTSTSTSR